MTTRRPDQRLELFEFRVCIDFLHVPGGWLAEVFSGCGAERADNHQVFRLRGGFHLSTCDSLCFRRTQELQFGNGAALVIAATRVTGSVKLEDLFGSWGSVQRGCRQGDGEAEKDGREFHARGVLQVMGGACADRPRKGCVAYGYAATGSGSGSPGFDT